jgi:hypothetical protein
VGWSFGCDSPVSVGSGVSESVSDGFGFSLDSVGHGSGLSVDGSPVGSTDGSRLGSTEGSTLGSTDGVTLGSTDGVTVGESHGVAVVTGWSPVAASAAPAPRITATVAKTAIERRRLVANMMGVSAHHGDTLED